MIHLVTVATHSERYLPVLDQQSKDKNMTLVKLAVGKKYTGHFMKDLEMLDYLKSSSVNDEDIVVFVDGFDTLLLANKKEIIEKFKSFDCDILLSIENVGSLSFIHSAVFQKVKGKFINTGLYMGYAKALKDFLQEMYTQEFDKSSNQKTWANYLEKKNDYSRIALDSNSDIFLNYSFTTTNKIISKNKRVYLDESVPCFIQGNGCEDLSKIIKNTGYKDYDIHNDKRTFKVIENNLKAVLHIYPIIALYISLIIFVIIIISLFIYNIYKNYKDKHFYIYL